MQLQPNTPDSSYLNTVLQYFPEFPYGINNLFFFWLPFFFHFPFPYISGFHTTL